MTPTLPPPSRSPIHSVSQPASQPSLRDVLSACPELSAGEPWIQQILSTHYVPGTVLGPGDTDKKEADSPAGQ